jgi:phosphosulfolactate synthase
MLVDWGIPLGTQQDLLELASKFIDLAKVAVGISGLISEDSLVRKLSTYRESGVEPFPGGQFLEYAYRQGRVTEYYRECCRVGYRLVEVSDNVVDLTPQDKERLIRQAIEEYGLRVLGEVGSKLVTTDQQALIKDMKGCLAAGAWKVLVEAAEFVTASGIDTSLVESLLAEVDQAEIMFELPGKWIANVHAYQTYQMMIWLIERVGPHVNIGNVADDDIVPLETLRTGVGVMMKI